MTAVAPGTTYERIQLALRQWRESGCGEFVVEPDHCSATIESLRDGTIAVYIEVLEGTDYWQTISFVETIYEEIAERRFCEWSLQDW